MTEIDRTHEETIQEAPDPIICQGLMEKYFRRASVLGFAKAGQTPEQFYGFSADDVADCHHYRVGFGEGFWFRLKDRRVFCAWTGLPAPSGTEDYEGALN